MRLSLLRKLVLASATCLFSLSLGAAPAMAQKPKPAAPAPKKPGGKPGGQPGGSQAIELDEAATIEQDVETLSS